MAMNLRRTNNQGRHEQLLDGICAYRVTPKQGAAISSRYLIEISIGIKKPGIK